MVTHRIVADSSGQVEPAEKGEAMCRSIKVLREPPATDDEVRAASLQFVRKISGYRAPSKANTEVFDTTVDDITAAARRLLDGLVPARPTARPARPSAGASTTRTTVRPPQRTRG
jgi:hypothetical protein